MHLRVAVADVDAVALDMLRKPTERKMGPSKHRELYQGAAGKLALLLANLPPDPDEDGPDARLRAASIAEMAAKDDAPPTTPRGGPANDSSTRR